MSFSNPKLSNPATKFIDFKGSKGVFSYYQKFDEENEKGEKGQNIDINLPVFFVVLDELNTIKGFNDETNSGIYSNEVHVLGLEPLIVRTHRGNKRIEGVYRDIKGQIKDIGGRFTKSVYALLINKDKSTEIVNFQLTGAAFAAWCDINFNKFNHIIGVQECSDEKKGATLYKKPIFNKFKLTPEIAKDAERADKQLQDFLKQYKENAKKQLGESDVEEITQSVSAVDNLVENDTDYSSADDLPF